VLLVLPPVLSLAHRLVRYSGFFDCARKLYGQVVGVCVCVGGGGGGGVGCALGRACARFFPNASQERDAGLHSGLPSDNFTSLPC
jgi:hypothetical protein